MTTKKSVQICKPSKHTHKLKKPLSSVLHIRWVMDFVNKFNAFLVTSMSVITVMQGLLAKDGVNIFYNNAHR